MQITGDDLKPELYNSELGVVRIPAVDSMGLSNFFLAFGILNPSSDGYADIIGPSIAANAGE